MRRPYSRESIAHALAHHEGRGALRTVSPPEPGGRKTWRVAFPHYNHAEPVEITEPQAWSLCLGLAASEDHARDEHERFVRELSQRDGPICLDDDLELEVALLRRAVRIANGQLDGMFAPLSGFAAVSDNAVLLAAVRRALNEMDRRTRCGIHGDDTTSGRCLSCDEAWLRSQFDRLDAATTLADAEGPFSAVVRVCEQQPRLIPVVLAWARTEASGVSL